MNDPTWTPKEVAGTLVRWLTFSAGIVVGIICATVGGPFWLFLVLPGVSIITLTTILISKVIGT